MNVVSSTALRMSTCYISINTLLLHYISSGEWEPGAQWGDNDPPWKFTWGLNMVF